MLPQEEAKIHSPRAKRALTEYLKPIQGPASSVAPLSSQLFNFYHQVSCSIEKHPTRSHKRTRMTSVNTPEEQAIAFLLICVEHSQMGKVCNPPIPIKFSHNVSKLTIPTIQYHLLISLAITDQLEGCLTRYWRQYEPRSGVSSSAML